MADWYEWCLERDCDLVKIKFGNQSGGPRGAATTVAVLGKSPLY